MPEFNKVEMATKSPTRCAFCHTHEGPFIDTHLERLPIYTATGLMEYEAWIYICTRPAQLGRGSGCAEQIALAGGTVADITRLEVAAIEIADLKKRLSEAQMETLAERNRKDVNVGKLIDEITRRLQPVEAVSNYVIEPAEEMAGW